MRPTSRLALACLIAPLGVPLVVVPLASLEAALGAMTFEEAALQGLRWSAFGMPAALMALIMFWTPLHFWLQSYAVRGVLAYLALALGVAGMLAYIVVVALPDFLHEVESWHWAALLGSALVVGLIAWAIATSAGRR
jgi:hypothetical protein